MLTNKIKQQAKTAARKQNKTTTAQRNQTTHFENEGNQTEKKRHGNRQQQQ